jgi:Tol biopolymer transport system component
MPDISRDGKALLFVTQRFGNWQLWEASVPDGRQTLLVEGRDPCFEPRWSRDGSRLLCTHYGPDYPVLLPQGGGNEERLVSKGFEAAATDWSPDGQFVVAVSGPGAHESGGRPMTSILLLPISAAPHAETQARLVTSTPHDGFYQMRFSPNGRWIAFELVKGDAVSGGTSVADLVGSKLEAQTMQRCMSCRSRVVPGLVLRTANRGTTSLAGRPTGKLFTSCPRAQVF